MTGRSTGSPKHQLTFKIAKMFSTYYLLIITVYVMTLLSVSFRKIPNNIKFKIPLGFHVFPFKNLNDSIAYSTLLKLDDHV